MGERDLPRTVLQDVGERTLQYSRRPALEAGSVISKLVAAASGFDADQSDFLVFQEFVENSDCVRSAADASDDRGWQLPSAFSICARASRPVTLWKSRTIVG